MPSTKEEDILKSIGLRSSHSSHEEEKEANEVLLGILGVLVDRKKLKLEQIGSAARAVKKVRTAASSSEKVGGEIEGSTPAPKSCYATDDETNAPMVKSREPIRDDRSSKSMGTERDKKGNDKKYLSRHIALMFHYDGSSYSGLAENMKSPTENSVE